MAASKTQKSNTRKKSTAKGNVSGKKKTAGRPSTRKNVNTKQSISSGFQTEIVILVLIAASIILMVSCLGFGGSVGGSISRALMGVMGLMAYAFPFVLFPILPDSELLDNSDILTHIDLTTQYKENRHILLNSAHFQILQVPLKSQMSVYQFSLHKSHSGQFLLNGTNSAGNNQTLLLFCLKIR